MSLARKRTLPSGESNAPAKKRRKPAAVLPQYHESPSVKNEDGSIQWPAPQSQIDHARDIILQSAQSNGRILIVPDKDADGQVLHVCDLFQTSADDYMSTSTDYLPEQSCVTL